MAVHAPFALLSITYSIISSWASFVIGPLDIRYINMPYVIRYSYSLLASPDHVACVIFAKTLTLANSSYYTLWIAVLGYHTDAFDVLHQSFWLSSALSVWDTHKQSCVLPSWDMCPDLAIICFKEVSFNAGSPSRTCNYVLSLIIIWVLRPLWCTIRLYSLESLLYEQYIMATLFS